MLEIQNLTKYYPPKKILNSLSFSLASSSFSVLLGVSGSGKTTLLKCIAGLEPIESGTIFWNDLALHSLAAQHRPLALLFQDLALWPHWTVKKTLVEVAKQTKQTPEKVEKWLNFFSLNSLENRKPHELSGGEAQRLALARALIVNPQLLLLDEPFANLDFPLREKSRQQLKQLAKEEKITVLLVTHDPSESLSLADQVLVIEQGSLLAHNSPTALYKNPTSSRVAQLLGTINLFVGERSGKQKLKTPFGEFSFAKPVQEKHVLGLWPENLIVSNKANAFQGEIFEDAFIPGRRLLRFSFQKQEWCCFAAQSLLSKTIKFSLASPPLLLEPII